jgi:hypothetical protein
MDKLLEIQGRLESGAYNPADYRKNAKFLQDKIAFMANRNSRGELRGKMGEAYALSKALLPRIEAMKPEGAAAPKVMAPKVKVAGPPKPKPVAAAAAMPAAVAAAGAAGANATLAGLNVPGINNVSKLRIRVPGKTRRSPKAKAVNNFGGEGFWYNRPYNVPPTRRESGPKRKTRAKKAAAPLNNMGGEGFWYNKPYPGLAKPKGKRGSKKRERRVRVESPLLAMNGNDYNRRIPASPAEQIRNEYLAQAAEEYLPMLPELYDPFTGEKFAREENPLPPIEKAYIMLKKLRQKTFKRAATLRKTAAKAAPAAAQMAASVLAANAGEV